MRIYTLMAALILCCHACIFAQKHDYIWTAGHQSFSSNLIFGGTNISFNADTIIATRIDRKMNFAKAINATISDSSGNLLFYSNGCFIANAENELIENGDSLNPGYVFNIRCDTFNLSIGYPSGFQSAIALPQPNKKNLYFMFHKRIFITSNPFDVFTDRIFYTVIDMDQNNGKGKVIAKNIPVIADSTLCAGEMTAVRHANGKDWWIASPGFRGTNKHWSMLFTENGIEDIVTQTIGDTLLPNGEAGGQAVFTPDGQTYIQYNPKNKIRIYDFDRSTGRLSNYRKVNVDFGSDDPFDGGCGVSPSGRFLYIAAKRYLYQFDLQAPDIEASQQTVAIYDGYSDPLPAIFAWVFFAPDCKLYVSPGDTRVLHVIHNPDEPGLACNVEQHGLHTPTYHGGSFPNFPNFRLRALGEPISPCEGYVVGSGEPVPSPLPGLSVFPNPMGEQLKLVANRDFASEATWTLTDAMGRVLRHESAPRRDECRALDVSGLPSGLYFYFLRQGARVLQQGKLVKP